MNDLTCSFSVPPPPIPLPPRDDMSIRVATMADVAFIDSLQMRLSGGERQRISLARAFLKDAPILILDEPTSSVDAKTEASIMDAVRRLMSGRTTFMIAHRLGTLDHCDVRLHVEDGRVTVATGAEPMPDRETGAAEASMAAGAGTSHS